MRSSGPAKEEPLPSNSATWLMRLRAHLLSNTYVTPLVAFFASRAVIFALIVLSRMIFVGGSYPHPSGVLPVLSTWDGAWYLDIATHGYGFRKGMAGFFPLYPLLIRAAAFVFSPTVAAVVVSHICLCGAAILLHRLFLLEYGAEVARDAIMLLMFNPASVYFSAAYTESTFLLLSAASFLAARSGRWLIAGLCGMALSATRYVGFLVLVPLAIEYFQQTKNRAGKARGWVSFQLLALCLVPLGLVLFYVFCYFQFHDPFAYLHTTLAWGRKLVPPWRTFANSQSLPRFHLRLYEAMMLIALGLFTVAVWLRVRWSYIAWTALLLASYLCSGTLEAFARYLSVVFPLFLVAALLPQRSRAIYDVLFVFSAAMLALCTILLANGYWMT